MLCSHDWEGRARARGVSSGAEGRVVLDAREVGDRRRRAAGLRRAPPHSVQWRHAVRPDERPHALPHHPIRPVDDSTRDGAQHHRLRDARRVALLERCVRRPSRVASRVSCLLLMNIQKN